MIVASANASGSLRRKQFFVVGFKAGGGAGCLGHWRMHRPDSYAFRSVDGGDVTETLHIGLLPTLHQQQPRPRSAEGRGREVLGRTGSGGGVSESMKLPVRAVLAEA